MNFERMNQPFRAPSDERGAEKEDNEIAEWHPASVTIINGEDLLTLAVGARRPGVEPTLSRLVSEKVDLLSILESLYFLHRQGPQGSEMAYKVLAQTTRNGIFTKRYLPLRRSIDVFRSFAEHYTINDLAKTSRLKVQQIEGLLKTLCASHDTFNIQQQQPTSVEENQETTEVSPFQKNVDWYKQAVRSIANEISAATLITMPAVELSQRISRQLTTFGVERRPDVIQLFLSQSSNRNFVKEILEGKV